MTCPWCGTGPLMLLGILGNLAHLRCRACGADSNLDAEGMVTCDEE